ncbi:hypothetical protein P7245_22365 [Vibrio parahaemolyticus]|nr:hypothetical protein [Vibrio parahaemolyticus]
MIKEIKGARGWSCYQAYVNFIFYINMADTYSTGFDNKDAMITHFKESDDDTKRKVVLEIMRIHPVNANDMMHFIGVHTLPNSSAFITPSTINNFNVAQLAEMVFESIVECSKISDEVFF